MTSGPRGARAAGPASALAVALVRSWQLSVSAVMPPSCRFLPSCSAYAVEAIERHGVLRGGWLALGRLMRCHPAGGCGYDPVPDVPARALPPHRRCAP